MSQLKFLPLVFAIVFFSLHWGGSLETRRESPMLQEPILFAAQAGSPNTDSKTEQASEQVQTLSLAIEVLYSRQYYRTATEILADIQDDSLRDQVIEYAFQRIAFDLGIPSDLPLETARVQSPFNQQGELTAMLIAMKDQSTDTSLSSLLDIRLAQYYDKLAEVDNFSDQPSRMLDGQAAEELATPELNQNVLERIRAATTALQQQSDSSNSFWTGTLQLIMTGFIAAMITLGGALILMTFSWLLRSTQRRISRRDATVKLSTGQP